MARVAFFTFAILKAPRDSAEVKGFYDRLPDVFEAAQAIDGFIDRSGYPDPGVGNLPVWGERVQPRFFVPEKHTDAPKTLSLWRDLESVSAFAYHGLHAEALQKRLDWFLKPEWPTYVAWWVADDHVPDWAEAASQLEAIADNGPTAQAFDFAHPFDPQGDPTTIDRDAVRQKQTAAGV